MRRTLGALAAMVLLVGILVPLNLSSSPGQAMAVDGSQFDPGNIISDEQFYAKGVMSQNEIQSFLNDRISEQRVRDQSGTYRAGTCGNSLCLRDLRVNTPTTTLAFGTCTTYVGEANEPASRIIYKVQEACAISARVLLVTLQKENSLVTKKSPSEGDLRKALGQGCPDTAACDSAFYGFFNQVFSAARQFAWYGNPAGSHTSIKVGQSNAVLYNPNTACGSSSVVIKNRATASLYYYTPYQPNAAALANLNGIGDGCSSYGNRNFWVYFNNWFGSTVAPKYGSFDSVAGVFGGIEVAGWSIDPTTTDSTYVWINVDGVGRPARADKALSWFPLIFPGYSPNHGFAETLSAIPGDHEVCVYGPTSLISCKWVNVPAGQGSFDSAVGTWGGVDISGWAVDFTARVPGYIWVNVDGVGGAYKADSSLPWINNYFPGVGANHGFDHKIPAAPGSHEVCAYGIYGSSSVLIGCRTVSVPRGTGALDSVTAAPGGLIVSGWSADYTRPDSSFVWVDVDGAGAAYRTNSARTWLTGHLPGIGQNNGFDIKVAARKGVHRVCVSGAVSLLGCSSAVVQKSADGSVDSIAAEASKIRIKGWSVDLTTAASSFIWVNINGAGGAYRANVPLSWFDGYYPGSGPNHGFDVTIPQPPGEYEVCVHGTEQLLACSTVTVS